MAAIANTIFFESNGGQAKAEATLPEVRLAVAEPDLDVGNVETVLEALSTTCYYLSAEKNRSRFSLSPNLNKLLADRRASVQTPRVEERIRAEVKKVFAEEKGAIDRICFPDKSGQIARSRFSLSPNLNKLLADRRASVQTPRVEERIRAEVQKVFAEEKGVIDRNTSRTRAVRLRTRHTDAA
jgi:hypothetical protein